jgi:FtsH-binding integral membrane protein
MPESDRSMKGMSTAGTITGQEAAAIDAGLRAHMLRIHSYMALGLAATGGAAFGICVVAVTPDATAAAHAGIDMPMAFTDGLYLTPLGYAVFVSPMKWAVILAPLAMVLALSFGMERLRPAAAQALFWVYAALIGLSLGSIFMVYTRTSVVRALFVSAGAFAGLSLWGYATHRDLSGMVSFVIMGLSGLIVAAVVNLFLASTMLQWAASAAGVLVFAGLTAWDTDRLKNDYIYGALDGGAVEPPAITGALSLYLDVVNLFVLPLQAIGQHEE